MNKRKKICIQSIRFLALALALVNLRGGGVTSEAGGTLDLSREAGALALVTRRGGGEGVFHGGGVTSEAG